MAWTAKPKSRVCEQNTARSVPKPPFKMQSDNMPEPSSIDRSIDDECPSPVLAGQMQLRFDEAHSSEDKQFSPIISALRQKHDLKVKVACDSRESCGKESMHSPVLQVVDANLPPVQTRIPSHIAVQTSKASSDASEQGFSMTNGISFSPHEGSDSSTPKVFGASQQTAASAFDHTLGCNKAAGIQLLTPVAGGPFAAEDLQEGFAEEAPAGGNKHVTTQPELHPLFQQASAMSIHVPVFHLPGTQEAKAPCQGNNLPAVADPKSPHVTITAPDLFVVDQECLSDPMPSHDPRKLLASEQSDQLIGTPPYAKFIRHLNGDEASPLHGEATLLVQQPSPVVADSPAPAPKAQLSSTSAATPDGRNFGDLLSAITAHEYHSPAPAMMAHLAGADMELSDNSAVAGNALSDTAPGAGMGQLLNAINANEYHSPAPAMMAHLTGADTAPADDSPSSGMGKLLSAISANEYHSPAPATVTGLGGADMARYDTVPETAIPEAAVPETLSPTFVEESLPSECTQGGRISKLESAEHVVSESKDAVTTDVLSAVPDVFTMGRVEQEFSPPLDLAVTNKPTALDSPKEPAMEEQPSFHSAGFHPVMTPQEDRSTPYFSPQGCEVSHATPTECETLMCSLSHMSAQRSSDHAANYVTANLQVVSENSSAAPSVTVSFCIQNSCAGTDTELLATGPAVSESLAPRFSQSPTAGSEVVQLVQSHERGDLESAISLELPVGIAPAEQPSESPISCTFLETSPPGGNTGSFDVSLGGPVLFSPVAFLSESEGGFSFGLSPSSACRESVASVGCGVQQLFSPVLQNDDQLSLCQSASVTGDNDKVNLLSPTKIDSPVKTMSPEPRGKATPT